MTDVKSTCKKWEDMETDVLVKIFKELNMLQLSPVSQVCRSWRLTSSDPLLWNTFDLGLLKSNFIQTRASPYVWVNDRSDRRLTEVLRVAMSLSRGNVTCMVFHFNLYLKDDHLNHVSERCPHIKRLVMPAWNRITKGAICDAIRRWQKLESMTMPCINQPLYIMEEISANCKNFSQLKIMDAFDIPFALALATHLPNLKVLSLRCCLLPKESLLCVLDCMDQLEVLNISHSIIQDSSPSSATSKKQGAIREFDRSILEKASRLREFYYCQSSTCLTCQRMARDEGQMRWWKYEESFWREDEVSSLSLGDYGRLLDEGCVEMGRFRD